MRRDELLGIIKARGLTQAEVAEHLGITSKTFYEKMKRGVFGSDEVDKMIDFLKIEDPMWIFFERKVTYKDTKKLVFTKH